MRCKFRESAVLFFFFFVFVLVRISQVVYFFFVDSWMVRIWFKDKLRAFCVRFLEANIEGNWVDV